MKSPGQLLYRTLLAMVGGLPLLVLSILLMTIWINPAAIGDGSWVKFAATLIMVEFILLHSGAFMATGPIVCKPLWLQWAWFLGFGLVYSAALSLYADWSDAKFAIWLLLGFLGSRMVTLVLLKDKRGTIMMLQRSAVGVIVLLITALILIIPLPKLGITEEVRLAAFGHADDVVAGNPQKTIAWGILYFFLMSLIEFYAGWLLPDFKDEDVEKAWIALGKSD